jgi:hypothetical protein
MKNFPNLLIVTLAASVGACTSLSLASLPTEGQTPERPREPNKTLVVDATGNWLRVSQETRQGLYLSQPAQRWIF